MPITMNRMHSVVEAALALDQSLDHVKDRLRFCAKAIRNFESGISPPTLEDISESLKLAAEFIEYSSAGPRAVVTVEHMRWKQTHKKSEREIRRRRRLRAGERGEADYGGPAYNYSGFAKSDPRHPEYAHGAGYQNPIPIARAPISHGDDFDPMSLSIGPTPRGHNSPREPSLSPEQRTDILRYIEEHPGEPEPAPDSIQSTNPEPDPSARLGAGRMVESEDERELKELFGGGEDGQGAENE